MNQQLHTRPSFWKSPWGLVATAIAAVASLYLYLTHRDHMLALLPYAILVACPLMHFFMHRGHAHGRHSGPAGRNQDDADDR